MASEQRKAFLLRISADLWKELEKWAADDLRSVNAQIEFLLREALARRRGTANPDGSHGAGSEGSRNTRRS